MIMRLSGVPVERGLDWVLMEVGGVGYRVQVSLSTSATLPLQGSCVIWTHEVVREDRRELFGFATREDLELFWKLIEVNGVGPKVAQKLLGAYAAPQLKALILEGDVTAIKKVPGVGMKTSQKIVLELRGSVSLDQELTVDQGVQETELFQALTSLGYPSTEARELAKTVPEGLERLEDQLKAVLRQTDVVA